MKKIIVFCVAFLATMSLWASETSVNAIWYDFDSIAKTASVTSSSEYYGEYTGEVVIPSTVMYEGEEYNVTSIGSHAFSSCGSLTSITIPESVTEIASSAFGNCSSLTSIDVAPNNENYASIDGVLFSKDKTILIQYPEGKDATSYIIPEGVTEIENYAFWNCSSLTSITLPESVTEIGKWAFDGCSSLTSITIPESVTSIGVEAFYHCNSLTSIDVASNNNNYASIDGVLFSKDKTILIQYPEGKDATSYIIPEGVTEIGRKAFHNCDALKSVTIPESVTEIGSLAFSYCSSLTSITIPESVTSIGITAFDGCNSLTSIDVASNNNNYTSIDGVLFSKDKTILIKYPEGKDATSYIIPEGVTEIENYAFWDCDALKSVTIPEGVTTIGDAAFIYCSSLTSITCKNTTPLEVDYFTFGNVDKSIPLYVPAESVEAYKNAEYWKEFTNIQAIPPSSVANAKAETQDFVRKEYRDGQVLIIKGDKTYTMFGTEY